MPGSTPGGILCKGALGGGALAYSANITTANRYALVTNVALMICDFFIRSPNGALMTEDIPDEAMGSKSLGDTVLNTEGSA